MYLWTQYRQHILVALSLLLLLYAYLTIRDEASYPADRWPQHPESPL